MSENGYATAEQLLGGLGKRRYRDVTLPICGMKVRIQSLMEGELAAYQRAVIKSTAKGSITFCAERLEDANRRLMSLCLVDGSGNRLIADGQHNALANMDSVDSQVLYEACSEHCGISREDIEDIAKNSEAMAAAGSRID